MRRVCVWKPERKADRKIAPMLYDLAKLRAKLYDRVAVAVEHLDPMGFAQNDALSEYEADVDEIVEALLCGRHAVVSGGIANVSCVADVVYGVFAMSYTRSVVVNRDPKIWEAIAKKIVGVK